MVNADSVTHEIDAGCCDFPTRWPWRQAMTLRWIRAVNLGTVLLLAGCSDSNAGPFTSVGPGSAQVGGSCSTDTQCQSRCVTSDGFPGGMCTVSCASDADCPLGTGCIDDNGGICAVLCTTNACSAFGPTWTCSERNRPGDNGKISVCRGA